MNSAIMPVLTNVRIYRSIADAAHRKMSEDMGANVRPAAERSDVVIKTFDPDQLSFKQAMISVVFTCIWLEATLHLLIVARYGRESYTNRVDRCGYEGKLKLLDCREEEMLKNVEQLRKARRDLVHEKAHLEFNDAGEFTGELRAAQDEAENARAVMLGIEKWFGLAD